jgi:hypothetical protein
MPRKSAKKSRPYEFVKRQKELYEAQLPARANERSAVLTLTANALAQRDQERSLTQRKRGELKSRVDAARADSSSRNPGR